MYPSRLLPSKEKIELFGKLDDCYLCRSTSDSDSTWKREKNLNDAEVSIKISGNSCNLVDPHNNINCCTVLKDVLIYVINKQFTDVEWDGQNESVPKVEDVEYEIQLKKGYYLLKVSDFHGHIGEYPFGPIEKTETRKYKILIRHSPNLVNICHFDINSHKLDEEQPINPNKKGKWVNDLKHIIRERIVEKALNGI